MYLAHTLSRGYLPEVNACNLNPELEEIDHKQYFAVSEEHLQQINHASADDPVVQQLHATVCCGWPEYKSDVPETIYPYYDHRGTLTVQGELVFKGQQLVVPACLRKELMSVAHSTHIEIGGFLCQFRESL